MSDKKIVKAAEDIMKMRLLSPPWDSTRFVYVSQEETETFAPDNSYDQGRDPSEGFTFSITDGHE